MLSTIGSLVGEGSSGGAGAFLLIWFVLWIVEIVAFWKVFTKAGEPGWKCLIPIYNIYILLKIVGRPGWWLILFLIPIVNIVILILVMLDLAKSFGKGVGFAIGLIFLSFIFMIILGFGDARYMGPAAAQGQVGGGYPPPPPPPSA